MSDIEEAFAATDKRQRDAWARAHWWQKLAFLWAMSRQSRRFW